MTDTATQPVADADPLSAVKPGATILLGRMLSDRLKEMYAEMELQEDACEISSWMDQYGDEFLGLQSLASQAAYYGGLEEIDQLVRRDCWTSYYRMAVKTHVSPRPMVVDWIETAVRKGLGEDEAVIDWQATADLAAMDYAEVCFGEVPYLLIA